MKKTNDKNNTAESMLCHNKPTHVRIIHPLFNLSEGEGGHLIKILSEKPNSIKDTFQHINYHNLTIWNTSQQDISISMRKCKQYVKKYLADPHRHYRIPWHLWPGRQCLTWQLKIQLPTSSYKYQWLKKTHTTNIWHPINKSIFCFARA